MRPASLRRAAVAAACAVTLGTALPVWAATGATSAAASSATKVLTRDLLPARLLSAPTGVPAATQQWHVGISLAGKDAAGLSQLVAAQADPASSSYQQFLTPAQYAERFGAGKADTDAVRAWATRAGLTVSYANGAGTYLVVSGTVAQVERTFGTTLRTYTANGQAFTANATAPTVPSQVIALSGLDTLSSTAHTSAAPVAATPSAAFPVPSDTRPQDLWSLYDQPAANTGQGEKLAAFGWGSPAGVESDLRLFEAKNSLPQIPFHAVQVGGAGTDTSGQVEWDLDSQAATGMAPNASDMTFYFAPSGNSDLLAAAINTWADDAAGAKQASGSYGLCDVFGFIGTFDAHEAALTQAAAEGRSFFASTGDNGSGCSAAGAGVNGVTIGPIPSQEYPATSPHSVAVGGTVVYTTGSGATTARDQEIAWTHGGGGPSYYFEAPAWQAGSPFAASGFRAEADVAAQSGDLLSGYQIFNAGAETPVGGTSLSAPLWQGMWARVNAAGPRGADGVANLGFAAPLVWQVGGNSAKAAQAFYDVTIGDNGLYPALPGYDYPTGFGAPRVSGLAQVLAGKSTATAVDSPLTVATTTSTSGKVKKH